MAKKIQGQSQQPVGYNRPNLEWRCGHTCSGKSCPLGPNVKGECSTKQSECYPVRKNDRWQCTRSDTYGGKCEQGPNPDGSCCSQLTDCQPIRSLSSKRKMLTLVTVAATIGFILMFIGGDFNDSRKMMSNSGRLTSAHSPEKINCLSCHENITAKAGADAGTNDVHQGVESPQCLTCHAKEVGHWETSRFAHGLAPEEMKALVAKAQLGNGENNAGSLLKLAGHFSLRDKGLNGELTCSTCHKEHNGPDFDLTAMSSQQCQSCHQNKFKSFSQGHPEFSNYPYERKTRIFFDHIKHFQKHFSAQSNEWAKLSNDVGSCNACHTPDREGREMALKSFDQSCATCHSNLTEKGEVVVVSIPSMDTQAIKGWPKPPLRGPIGLSPITQLLIALNENSYESIKGFYEIKDPLNLKETQNAEKAENLKSSVQKLIAQWREKGGSNIFDSKNSQASPAYRKLAQDMLSAVPPETFERLLKELNQAEMDQLEPMKKEVVADSKDKHKESKEKAEEKANSGEDINLFDLVEEKVEAKKETPKEEINLFDLVDESDESKKTEEVNVDKGPKIVLPASISESASGRKQWSEKSNWAYDNLAISYRPQGHADPFLKALIEYSAAETVNSSVWSGKLAQQILESTTAGKCLNCHTVDLQRDGSAVVNWHAKESVSSKEFTRFVHAKHAASPLLNANASVVDAKQQTCFTCHVFSEDTSYSSFFASEKFSQPLKQPIIRDPHLFKSNFKNIDMQNTCARCHTPNEAGDNCLKCHNYHVDKL
jgi:hypothetical protein